MAADVEAFYRLPAFKSNQRVSDPKMRSPIPTCASPEPRICATRFARGHAGPVRNVSRMSSARFTDIA